MDYLFRECMAVHARNKVKGNAKGHRYSALLVRFSCMLRAKMNAAGYNLFRKAFCLPHNTKLMKYSCADTSSPDGLMMESTAQASQMMDDLKVDDEDFHQEGNLS